jgi:hypothetical protein
MNGVNLIPLSRQQATARRARVRLWLCVIAASAVLAVSGGVTFRFVWSPNAGPLQSDIAIARSAAQASKDRIAEIRKETAALERDQLAARTVGEHPDWSLLLRAINQLRGDGVALQKFELHWVPPEPAPAPAAADPSAPRKPLPPAIEQYTATMRGVATDMSRVMAFVGKLEQLGRGADPAASGVLDSVTLKQSRAQLDQGVTITDFEIVCGLRERPAPLFVGPPAPDTATAVVPEQETTP